MAFAAERRLVGAPASILRPHACSRCGARRSGLLKGLAREIVRQTPRRTLATTVMKPMADAQPPDGPDGALNSADELALLWDRFRTGGAVACPGDGVPLALAVDASAGVYRFVCPRCGVASPWFESGPGGLVIRGHSSQRMPAHKAGD